jgi:hypothetical protein
MMGHPALNRRNRQGTQGLFVREPVIEAKSLNSAHQGVFHHE